MNEIFERNGRWYGVAFFVLALLIGLVVMPDWWWRGAITMVAAYAYFTPPMRKNRGQGHQDR